ncbi:MAG: hypothetical protein C4583_09085 [Anaerolineaceae bacterium]|nr:MAG: hypothetical protein C4583_09085 [Anaerolineaceae bacterium]
MKHPLDFIPNEQRKPLFLSLLFLTLILFAVFRVLDTPLRTAAAPNGIVSYELAGEIKPAAEILASWDARAQLFAAFGLGLDYLFMPAYALTLALGILLAASRHPGAFAKLGAWLGWGALAAALFDAAENFSLWQFLLGDFQALWPCLAALCATAKFGLLLLGLAYALIGWLWPKSKRAS